MPDALDSTFPLTPEVKPEAIRARTNSSTRTKLTVFAGGEALEIPDKSAGVDKPLGRSEKNEIELDSYAESLTTKQSTWFDKRALEHRCVTTNLHLLNIHLEIHNMLKTFSVFDK